MVHHSPCSKVTAHGRPRVALNDGRLVPEQYRHFGRGPASWEAMAVLEGHQILYEG
jgi:hypothetical protein